MFGDDLYGYEAAEQRRRAEMARLEGYAALHAHQEQQARAMEAARIANANAARVNADGIVDLVQRDGIWQAP